MTSAEAGLAACSLGRNVCRPALLINTFWCEQREANCFGHQMKVWISTINLIVVQVSEVTPFIGNIY